MSTAAWDRSSTVSFAPVWQMLEKGNVVSVVVDCLVFSSTQVLGVSVPDGRRVRLIGEICQKVKGCRRMTVLDAVFDLSVDPLDSVDLLVTDSTLVIAHGLSPASDMWNFVELCAGVSCTSVGLTSAGFNHIGSVEWRPKLAQLHSTCHAGVPVITGDITEPACVRALLQKFQPPFCLMSGISCQPYSSGGSQGGSDDDRSSTLPATVKLAYLCQSPVLIIECVTQARSNRFVKSILSAMESQLGYHLSEVSLKLEDNWAARRFRWWVVASHPALGPITVPDWPKSPGLCIRDLMPYIRQWPTDVLQELELTEAELQLFTLDGSSMRRYVMQGEGKLPTCLHSWGSQAGECPCGCRQAGFSEHLVKQRGIYAQVIAFTKDDGSVAYRHLHPCELSLLNAMPPPHQWFQPSHPDLRLCLGAIGQLASPLQAVWVGACVISKFHHLLDLPLCCPKIMLQEFRSRMFMCAKEMYPSITSMPATMHPTDPAWVNVTHPDGTSVHIQVGHETTFAELCQAELALTQQDLVGNWCDADSGKPFEANDPIAGKSIRVISEGSVSHSTEVSQLGRMQVDAASAPDSSSNKPEPVWVRKSPGPDGSHSVHVSAAPDVMLGLTHLSGVQLASLLPPVGH